jgi:ADP-sugar diphosphatase
LRTFKRTMYTLETINFKSCKLPVTVTSDNILQQEQLDNFRPFQQWLQRLDKNLGEYELQKIHIQSVDIFSKNRIGFLKLKTQVVHPPTRKTIPGIVLLRGPTVAMLVILEPPNCASDAQRYAILVSQPRVPVGDMNLLEMPAGMIDDGTFKGSAAKEIQEECGITINEDELKDLTPNWIPQESGILLSPGLVDESCRFYACTKKMPLSEIHDLDGKLQMGTEHENISLKLVPLDRINQTKVQDAKFFLALGLYKSLPASN